MKVAFLRRFYSLLGGFLLLLSFAQYWYWRGNISLSHTFREFRTSTTATSGLPSASPDLEQVESSPPVGNDRVTSESSVSDEKTVVMAVLESENATWAERQLPDWQNAIYHVEDPHAYYHVPMNKGKEAMAYLTFIIDFYEKLPSIIAFVHSHLDGFPAAWHTDRTGYSNVKSLNELHLDYVRKEGYANLRCNWAPGCPDEVQPFREPSQTELEARMREVWRTFFGNEIEIPKIIAAACCSQFAVSREQIRQRRKEDYERYRQWLVDTDLDNDTSGRIFEFLWHVIMGREPVHCPELFPCYMNTYGLLDFPLMPSPEGATRRPRYRCRQNGCKRPPKYPHKDPIFGLDLFFILLKARKNGNTLALEQDLFDRVGQTYECNSWGSRQIHTMQPENIHAVLVSSFHRFGVQTMRLPVGEPFIGPGVFSTDGPYWRYSRGLIKPMFAQAQISDLDALQKHLERMMERIPHDGSTVELQSLLKLMYLDHSTEMIFGESTSTLLQETPDEGSNELLKSYTAALQRLGLRIVLGRLMIFRIWDSTYVKLSRKVHAVVDKYIDKTFLRKESPNTKAATSGINTESSGKNRFVIVDELAKSIDNRDEIRNQLLNIFLPTRDAAALTLSGTIFHLARHPNVWKKLRTEVLAIQDQTVTYSVLQSLTYLKAVLNESLRLTAPASSARRQATLPTTLPTGGGRTRTSPIFISKGDLITLNFGAIHRDPSIWGPDANEFRPERWLLESSHPSSTATAAAAAATYMPFSTGPRICPGKQMAMTENAYVLVQLARRFERVENRDGVGGFVEESRLTVESRNGVKVGLIPAN
ncbi:MAG: hypothetical protein Q9227_000507 [Pyrenula ochraceoflavens]